MGGKDAIIDVMATSIISRLPPVFDTVALRKKYMGSEVSPTIVVLMQELDRLAKVPFKTISKNENRRSDRRINLWFQLNDPPVTEMSNC